jgi:hypothetical protein
MVLALEWPRWMPVVGLMLPRAPQVTLPAVQISQISIILSDFPGGDQLRLMRCFRVFRLFKRIPSLRQIIVALSSSIPPMTNAFLIVLLVTAIYAIVSVTFFSGVDPDFFGTFASAMFTMFQIMTGVARNLDAAATACGPTILCTSSACAIAHPG